MFCLFLDVCIHWIHTCVCRNMQNSHPFTLTTPPQLILDHPRRKFSQDHPKLQKLNQLKPVLAQLNPQKTSNFQLFALISPTFSLIFIFSESLDPQDLLHTNSSRIHPVLMKKNITPGKWLYQFDFYCIVIYMIH